MELLVGAFDDLLFAVFALLLELGVVGGLADGTSEVGLPQEHEVASVTSSIRTLWWKLDFTGSNILGAASERDDRDTSSPACLGRTAAKKYNYHTQPGIGKVREDLQTHPSVTVA